MVKVVTTKRNINSVEQNKRVIFEIITNLEKVNFGLNLFTRRPKTRMPLLEHERPLSLIISTGALYEALNQFNSIKSISRKEIMQCDKEEVKEAMNFLCDKKVEEFKSSILNDIRNKSAFHADSEIVKYYFDNSGITDDEEIVVWQDNEDGSNNYPIANDILSFWFLNVLDTDTLIKSVVFIGEIYNHLRMVVHYLLCKWFKVSIVSS